VEVRNNADTLIYSTEKSLGEYGEKVSESDREQISAGIEDLKKAVEADDTDDIKAKTEALQQAAYKLAEEVYKDAGAQAEQQQPADEPEGGEEADSASSSEADSSGNVEDVDYEVVDDDEGDA
jgi:molecular chaperone DnaK